MSLQNITLYNTNPKALYIPYNNIYDFLIHLLNFLLFHLFLHTNGREPGQGPQWVIEPPHSGLKRQKADQKSKNESRCNVFSTIESRRVGIPAYYAKSYPLYLRRYGSSKLFIG